MTASLEWLLVAHIAVLGYWLGSEFVINSTYRYAALRTDVPFAERTKLMEHVMHADQHVRYALVLQATLGTMLAALLGYVPGGEPLAWTVAAVGAAWLVFVEAIHRLRHAPVGRTLGAIDRGSRWLILALLVAVAVGLVGGAWPMPVWLRLKLACFAGVIACGVGIRLAVIGHFRTWAVMAVEGSTPAHEAVVRRAAHRGTAIVVVLWMFIAAIAVLSVAKPG